MLELPIERRVFNRRARGGGRRVTDPPSRSFEQPLCPECRAAGMASLAGESDGGWWFVCLACDYLWDQRRADKDLDAVATEIMGSELHRARGASFWRRLTFRRAAV